MTTDARKFIFAFPPFRVALPILLARLEEAGRSAPPRGLPALHLATAWIGTTVWARGELALVATMLIGANPWAWRAHEKGRLINAPAAERARTGRRPHRAA
ncbi:hypothetical protein JCM17961_20930 [Endothiovibrio diazotrophicus]